MEKAGSDYHVIINSQHNLFSLNLDEVWRYRDLIIMFTKRSFTLTYKQTILGPIWIFLNPFLTSIMYTLVFGRIAGIGTDGIPKLLFYLSSNAIWIYFSTSVTRNANTFTSNANVFGKIYFPRLTVPLSNVLSAIIQFSIQMLMVTAFLLYYVYIGQIHPNWWAWLLIPGILVHLGMLGLGFGILISSLTTKYRDLSILVSFGVQLWMYASPVVYPFSQLGGSQLANLVLINPATPPIELFRYAFLGQGMHDIRFLLLSWAITIIVFLLGVIVFNKTEKTFMDTV